MELSSKPESPPQQPPPRATARHALSRACLATMSPRHARFGATNFFNNCFPRMPTIDPFGVGVAAEVVVIGGGGGGGCGRRKPSSCARSPVTSRSAAESSPSFALGEIASPPTVSAVWQPTLFRPVVPSAALVVLAAPAAPDAPAAALACAMPSLEGAMAMVRSFSPKVMVVLRAAHGADSQPGRQKVARQEVARQA